MKCYCYCSRYFYGKYSLTCSQSSVLAVVRSNMTSFTYIAQETSYSLTPKKLTSEQHSIMNILKVLLQALT